MSKLKHIYIIQKLDQDTGQWLWKSINNKQTRTLFRSKKRAQTSCQDAIIDAKNLGLNNQYRVVQFDVVNPTIV